MFGQRQVSTIYNALNQYHVIMEADPAYIQSPDSLNDIYISTSGGVVTGSQASNAVAGTSTGTVKPGAAGTPTAAQVAGDSARNLNQNQLAQSGKGSASTGAAISSVTETMVPLSTVAHYGPGTTALSVNHQGLFAASTISFNLAPGVSLGQATALIADVMNRLRVPNTIQGGFAGTAKTFQASLSNEHGADPRRAAGGLYRPRHFVRKLHPPADHPLRPCPRPASARCWR